MWQKLRLHQKQKGGAVTHRCRLSRYRKRSPYFFFFAREVFRAFLAGALRVAFRFAAGLRVDFLVFRLADFAAGFFALLAAGMRYPPTLPV